MTSIKCPICQQTDHQAWGKRNDYELYQCVSCTHKFADLRSQKMPRNDPDLFREEFTHGLMDSDVQYYEHLAAGEGAGKPTMVATEHILDLCRRNEVDFSSSWLDVGSGSGYLLSQVQKAGFTALGIEPGGWGRIAAERKGLNITQGFLSSDTFTQNFDVVSATDVIEHVPNPIEFLELLAGYVAPRGYLIITIPFADSFEAKLMGDRWDMVEPPTHCQFFSMRSLKLALEQVEMEVVSSRQFNIRNMRGLSRYYFLRRVLDALVPGPQFVFLAQRIDHTPANKNKQQLY